jgi:oligopeptide transport system substrate-binding protein
MKKRFLSLLLAGAMVVSLAACGGGSGSSDSTVANDGNTAVTDGSGETTSSTGDTYTYRAYSTSLATNWNPHTWEMSSDDSVLNLITTPLINYTLLDSENAEYQIIYEAATSMTDVTADHTDDLTKYNVTLPEGETAEEQTEGYVYEFALNPEMKWEDGTVINADTYIYSFQQYLNPDMKNYRANTWYSGDGAIAGAYNYFYSKDANIYVSTDDLENTDGLYIDVYDFWGADSSYTDADGNSAPQYVSVLDETVYGENVDDAFSGVSLYTDYFSYLDSSYCYRAEENENLGTTFDQVGIYKVDDYTIRMVLQQPLSYSDMIYQNGTGYILVYESLYEACKTQTGDLVTSTYGTSLDTTMSYGPYKITGLQEGKQMVFEQNENWYGYEKQADGSLISYTDFLVDGESVQQYQTQKYIIDVMDDDAAKQAFLKGQLSEWMPSTDDLVTYSLSDQLYKADQTFTERFFFNTNLEALQNMDAAQGTVNAVVMSNINFRKAFSLSIDRTEWVGATPGWKPAYYLLNSLYYYNIFEDPTSCYRDSDPAMQAICDLYGVEYGTGSVYATLEDAYNSITGYNLTEAKALMKQACEELVAAGLYTEGEEIKLRIAWKAGSLDSADAKQCTLIENYLNAAIEGSGFGKITLEQVGNLSSRYSDVPNGLYPIGFGAWGGNAFGPFSTFRVYMDPDYTSVHEISCYDPTTETLTLNIEGEDVTMTWQQWSNACTGTGKYSNASNDVKLQITALLEENFLEQYYCIPLAAMTDCTMYSYQVQNYTDEYNIFYGFGGLRLMTYNYTDAEWTDYIASQGGTISYE